MEKNMRAQEQTVLNLIGGLDKCFVIPPFQRNYEWTFEQCDELFEDIVVAYKTGKSHYLGNVVYYVGKNSGAAYSEYILVDGQQRVTTILLLLCAIRSLVSDDIKKSINQRYLKNDTSSDKFRIRLKQTSYDTDSFIAVVDDMDLTQYSKSNVVKNYLHFIELLKESSVSPEDIYNTIPKLEIVDVNLQINDDLTAIQTVFEKINSTGKKLTSADLIRNYLLLANNSNEQEELYKNYWVKIEQLVTNQYISKFARDYLIMNIYEDVAEADVYKMFKSHFNETNATHLDILREMFSLSKYFSWIKFEQSPNDKINHILGYLSILKTDDLYPLFIYLFYKLYDNDVSLLIKLLNLLTDFMIRYRIVAPYGGGGSMRSLFYQLLEKLSSDEIELTYESLLFELSNSSSLSGRFPEDEEFKEALMQDVNVNYARALLLRIEEYETKNIPLSINKVTTEHLMPQKLSDWWIEYLGGREQAMDIHDRYLNCIGNLAPMSSGDKSNNSNNPWYDKLQQISDVQFVITSEIENYQEWKESDIKNRNEDISNRACKAITSPLPRTRKYQTKVASEEFKPGLYPISDTTTPMNSTNVTEIIFDGTVKKIASWRELFLAICSIANEFDSELLKRIVEENSIHKSTKTKNYPCYDPILTTDKSLVNQPILIDGTNIYVEANLSSNRIRVYTKQLMDIYGITNNIQINVEA